MKRILAMSISTIILAAPMAEIHGQRAAALRAVTARFILSIDLQDEYHSTTDKTDPRVTGKADATLHLQLEASRWIKMQAGDGGSTDFLSMEGPSPGSIVVDSTASNEERAQAPGGRESVGKSSSRFNGKLALTDTVLEDGPVSVSLPQGSDLGQGLAFAVRSRMPLTGTCQWSATDEDGTKTSNNCAAAFNHPGGQFHLADETGKKNDDRTPVYGGSFESDLTIDPPLSRDAEKSGTKEQREKLGDAWIGADTRGDRAIGYKTTLTSTKILRNESQDGVTQKEQQKIIFSAQIVPGSPSPTKGSTSELRMPQTTAFSWWDSTSEKPRFLRSLGMTNDRRRFGDQDHHR
jgi:hypothetical protein